MPRVTTKGQVTIPKEIRDELGIEPGDEVSFEPTDGGYAIRKAAPTTETGADPFETYRGRAASDETMPERMERLRGDYPRTVDGGESDPSDEAADTTSENGTTGSPENETNEVDTGDEAADTDTEDGA